LNYTRIVIATNFVPFIVAILSRKTLSLDARFSRVLAT